MDIENTENIDPQAQDVDLSPKPKGKRKVLRKVKRKKIKKDNEEELEPSKEDVEALNAYQVFLKATDNIISVF